MAITRKVISRMQWWTPPASPAKGRQSTALSRSLGQTYAEVEPNLFSEDFSLLLCCYGGCCLELVCDTYRGRYMPFGNFGLTADDWQSRGIGKQCRLGPSKHINPEIQIYRNTKIQKNCKNCNPNSNFLLIKAIMRK